MAGLTTRRRYTNVAPAATVLAPLNASATTFGISTGTGFPAVPFTATIDYQTPAEETILVTGLSGTTVTGCTRGYDGTSAQSHSAGAAFVHTAVAKDYDEANDHTSSTAAHGTTGPIVGTTDAQTITNKTISSSKGQATTTDPAHKAQANASGVAALYEGYNSAGTGLRFKVGRNGDLYVELDDASKQGLIVKGAAAQATDLLRLLNSASAQLLVADKDGRIISKPTSLTGGGWKLVPPNDTLADFLVFRNAADSTTQLRIDNLGGIEAAVAVLKGFLGADVLKYPSDGSLFKVDGDGDVFAVSLTLTGNLVADTVVADDVVRRVAHAGSSSALAATSSEAKDTGCGDLAFTAVAGRKYRIRYVARANAVSATATCDFRIRDGGGGSPTSGSTLLSGASSGSMAIGGADARQVIVDALITGLSAGTHTIAAFFLSTSGGTVAATQSTGQERQLTIYDEGTV